MDLQAATGFIEQVNERIDPVALLERIGYATDKIQIVGSSVKAFCPIHHDTRFRSLLIDAKKGTFKCTTKTCDGFKGGNLVELYATVRGLGVLAAASELVRIFGFDIETSHLDQVAASFLDEAERAFVDHDHERAEAAARQALQFRSDLLEARLLLANILAAKGESAQACDEYIAVAENYLAQHAFEDVDRVLERASIEFPANEDLLWLKAQSAERQGRLEQAEQLLLELAGRREASGRKVENTGVFEKLLSLFPEKLVYGERLAEVFLERREFDKALTTLNNLAFEYANQGRHEDVVRVVERAAAIGRPEAGVQSVYVDALVATGRLERAREATHELVLGYIENSMFFEAQETAKRWATVEPDSVEVHEWLALVWQEQANGPEAAKEFQLAAHLAWQRGDVERAIALLGQARYNAPEDTQLRWELIGYLRESGQTDQASEELQALADYLFATGQGEDAEKALLQILDLKPTTSTRLELAPQLAKHGRTSAAARLYREAAHDCEEIDDIAGAVACYQSYLELEPEDREARLRYAQLLWESDLVRLASQVTLELLDSSSGQERSHLAECLLPLVAEKQGLEQHALERFLDLALEASLLEPARQLFQQLDNLWGDSDAVRAIATCRRLLELSPEELPWLEALTKWYQKAGQSAELVQTHLRIADLAESRGETRLALAHLAAALECEPGRTDLLKRRADLLATLDDPELARSAQRDYLALVEPRLGLDELLSEYRRFLERWPDDVDIRRRAAEALEKTGRIEAALSEYLVLLEHARNTADLSLEDESLEKIVALAPDRLEYKLELAHRCTSKGEVERAVAVYKEVGEKALEKDDIELAETAVRTARSIAPSLTRWDELELEIATRRGDEHRREQAAQRLADSGTPGPLLDIYRQRVASLLCEKRPHEAQAIVEKWLALAPTDLEALEAAAEVAQADDRRADAVRAYKNLAEACLAAGLRDRAITALRRAETLDPEVTEIEAMLVQAYLDAGREHEALETMGRLAEFFIDRRDYRNASSWLSRILEYRTNSPETLERLASLVYEYEGFAKALPYYRRLIESRRERGETDEICQIYERLLRLENTDIQLRREYAEFLEQLGQLATAKQQYLLLGQICRDELADPVQAIPFLGKATLIEPSPADAPIFEEIAALYSEAGQFDFAAGSLRDAIRLYEMQNELGRALAAQKRLCQLPGASVNDWEHLGDLAREIATPAEALAAYKTAYRLAEESTLTSREQRLSLCEKILALAPDELPFAIALIEYLPAEAVAPRTLDLARQAAEHGSRESQLAILEAGKRVAPKNIDIRRALIAVWRETGQTERLIAELLGLCETATGKDARKVRQEVIDELRQLPRTPELSLKLADLMAASGDTEHAVEAYTTVAEEFLEAGQWQAALEAVQTALALDPGALAAPIIAKLYRASGGDPAAQSITERAFDAALLARSRTRALVLAQALLDFADRERAYALLERVSEKAGSAFLVVITHAYADSLLARGHEDDVREVVAHVLQLAGSSPDAWYAAAQIYRKLGMAEKAAAASLQAARLFAQAGAVTEEETCYRDVLEDYPDDVPTLETLVSFYERERRKPDVVELVKRLIDITLAKNEHAAAARWIRKYLEYDPGNLDLREKLIEQLIKAGSGDEAIEALLDYARMLRNLKFHDRALLAYERILYLDPENTAAMESSLELAEEIGDLERAARFLLRLAEIEAESGNLRGAADRLKQFLDRHPDQLRVWQRLAEIGRALHDERLQVQAWRAIGYLHAKSGDVAAAAEAFEQLVSLKPDDKDTLRMLLDCYAAAKLPRRAADVATKIFELECAEGDPAAVRQAALTVLAFDEQRAKVRKTLADTLASLGDYEEAGRQWWRAAEHFIAEKNYADAIACLEAITTHDPSNTDAWKRYADLLALTGDEDAARDALVQFASALVDRGQPEEACRVLDRVVEHAQLDPSVRERALAVYRRCGIRAELLPEIVWLAQYYLNRRQLEKAEELVREGLEIDPEDLSLLECRIEIARRTGKRDEVVFRLRDLAQKYLELGDKAKAASMLAELVAEDPSLVDVRSQLARIYEELDQIPRAQEEYLQVVRHRLEHGEIEQARDVAESALAGPVNTLDFRARLAEAFADHRIPETASRYLAACASEAEQKGQTEKAIQYLQRAVEVRPKWIEGYERLAELCTKANRPVEALSALEQLTDLLFEQKRLRETVDVLKRRIQLAPKEMAPRRQLIDILEVLGERDQRVQQLHELADLLIALGRIEEAVDVYRQLVAQQPDDPAILSRYLELFAQVGNELEVIEDYQRLAELYVKKGQFQEATRTFERILTIDRRQRDIREKFIQFLLSAGQRSRAIAEMARLADVCSAMGDYGSAVKWLSNAHALLPTDLNILESLAEAYARAGNAVAAAEHFYKLARACAPTDVWRAVAACRRTLELVPEHRPTREMFSPLLMQIGERAEAAANALALAELYRAAGETESAARQEALARQYEPETVESLTKKIREEGHDPKKLYENLVRLGDLLYQAGDIDRALEHYRRARQIDDSNPELIRKYVNSLLQIAPEHEAIADMIELARSYENRGAALRALETYEQILKIDSGNTVAKAGRRRMRKITNTE